MCIVKAQLIVILNFTKEQDLAPFIFDQHQVCHHNHPTRYGKVKLEAHPAIVLTFFLCGPYQSLFL
jgi:hypothetical protein